MADDSLKPIHQVDLDSKIEKYRRLIAKTVNKRGRAIDSDVNRLRELLRLRHPEHYSNE
jgi:hypothetical protein